MADDLKSRLVTQARTEGFAMARVCRPWDVPQVMGDLQGFLAEGYQGTMGWLADRVHWRGDPAALWPEAIGHHAGRKLYPRG